MLDTRYITGGHLDTKKATENCEIMAGYKCNK